MPDFHIVLFDYHGVPVYVRLDLGSATREVARFLGPKGVMEADGNSLRVYRQSGTDSEPSYYANGFPTAMRSKYVQEWTQAHPRQFGREPITENLAYEGTNWDDVKPHLWNFFQAVKSGKPVTEDAVFGNHAAIACHMANESYFRQKPVFWDRHSRTLSTQGSGPV